MTPDRLLTVADLAERHSVAVQTVWCWNSNETGPPYIKVGRLVRYRLRDVEAWERQHERNALVPGRPAAPHPVPAGRPVRGTR